MPCPPQYNDDALWIKNLCPQARFDVFYVYPTFYNGPASSVMDVYKTRLLPALKSNIKKNTAIFENASVYAPLYRQTSFKTLFLPSEQCDKIIETPYEDILAAFDYFDKNISCGRPFILAGHSQGSRVLANLLKKKFSSESLSHRLIAAYLLGYCLTEKEILQYPHLRPAQNAEDTGVIITYNTQSPSVTKTPIYAGKAVCINPLNWSCSKVTAAKDLNYGAVFFDRYGNPIQKIPHFTSAYIDQNGFLIAPDVDENEYSSAIFDRGIFHVFDYDFFFENLKSNAALRVKKYFSSSIGR
jgi:Protein of unknown function (DUF3089).